MADKDLSNPIRAVTAASVPEPIVAAPDTALSPSLAPSGPLELAQPLVADGLSTHYLERELSEVLRRPEMINFLDGGVLDGVWYWDLEAPEHEYMSPGFWRALGFDPAKRKHLAAEWQDLIFPEDRDLALDNFHRHVDNPDHPYDQIVRYRSATGGTVTVRCRGFAVRKDGRAHRMLGVHTVLRDSDHVETDRQLADLIALSPDAVLAWSKKRGILRWNRGAEDLYGVTESEAKGQTPQLLTDADFPEGWSAVEQSLIEGRRTWSGEVARRTRDGRKIMTSTRLSLIETAPGDMLILEIDRDITAERQRQENLRLLNRELNHRVKNLFSVVQSLVLMSSRGEAELEPVIDKIRLRIEALSVAHVASIDNEDHGAIAVGELMATLMRPYTDAGRQLSVNGDIVTLQHAMLTPFSMVFHELATNAVKYGGWQTDKGGVAISWELVEGDDHQEVLPHAANDDHDMLIVHWNERMPTEQIPKGETVQGFGGRLVAGSIRQMGGVMTQNWSATGLTITFKLPLKSAAEKK